MTMTTKKLLIGTAILAATFAMGPAFASSTVVKVSLWDKGAMSMNMLGKTDMRMGMGKAGTDMHMAHMGVQVSATTVPAGEVTFNVTNTSKQMVHEMVISPIKDTNTQLPYDKAGEKIDEDAAGHLGEVSELEPGKKGALKITLKPGSYLLYCNIPGHYVLGMWTVLTVK